MLDSAIDEATAGKSVGHDLQEGKLTLPVLLACEADPALGRRVREHLGEHGVPAGVVAEILSEVRAAGGVERARRKAAALADEAIRRARGAARLALPRRSASRWPTPPRTGAPDGDRAAQGPRSRRRGGATDGASGAVPAHWDSLAAFVRYLEQRGELRRITREIDPVLEVSALAQRAVRAGGPALLFERVKGSRYPLLINTYATRRRISWALGVPDLDEHARAILDLVQIAAAGRPDGQGPDAPQAGARRRRHAQDRPQRPLPGGGGDRASTSASCRS